MPISSADGHLAPPVSADMQQHLSDSSLETRESAIPLAPQPQQPQGSVMSPDRPRTASPASPSSKRRPGPISIPPQPQLVGLSTATVQKESPSSAASPPAKPSVSPLPPSRPTRPDDSTKTLNPGWSHPFPSSQVPGSSPPRPPRPARPSEALLIDATSQSLPAAAAATFPRTPEQQHAFDNEAVDLADFAENIQPPPAATSSAGDSPELGADRPRKASSHRKPVPRFLPSPTIPLPARLSISGFEALISGSSPKKRGASDQQPGGAQERKRQLEDVPVFSPRVGLGLADAGVQAREARRVRDSSHGRSARRQGPTHREGGDIGRQAILSWSDRIRQREWDEPRRQPPPPSGATMAPGTTYIGRNPSTDSYRPLQLLNTPAPQHHRRRGSEPLPSHIRKRSVSRSISKDEKGLQEVVVVPSSWDDDSIDGDHMLPLREASFRPERMAFEMLEWRSWFPRTVHAFYAFYVLAHYPATLFLDYNVIYMLAQLSLYPSFPSTTVLATRAVINVPVLRESTGWWVALGVYAGCTFLWLVGVSLLYEVYGGFMRPWSASGGRIPIARVYRGAASFNFACMASYAHFCFLWRVRVAPFQSQSPLAQAVKGTKRSDGIAETFAWYSQNWPTVVLLLPRAGLSLALLLLFGTTAYGTAVGPATERDSAYFNLNGTLTGFAIGVLLTNCIWAALRLLIVCVSALGLFCFRKPFSRPAIPFSAYYHPSRERLTLPDTPDDLDEKADEQRRLAKTPGWIRRRDQRLRSAILVCLQTSTYTSPAFSPFFKSNISTPMTRRPSDGQELDFRDRASEQTGWSEQYRLALLARRGTGDDTVEELKSPPGAEALAPYFLPPPRPQSPLMTFSPPTRSNTTASTAPPAEGLHRRVKSVPHEDMDEEALRRLQLARKHSLPPRPLSVHGLEPEGALRPALQSHFSFITEDSNSRSAVSTPGLAEGPPTRAGYHKPINLNHSLPQTPSLTGGAPDIQVIEPTLASVNNSPVAPQGATSRPLRNVDVNTLAHEGRPESSMTLSDMPTARDVRVARHVRLERRRMSQRLLEEVRRLGAAEEAVRQEERRLASLRRVSETPSEHAAMPFALPSITEGSTATSTSAPQTDTSFPPPPTAAEQVKRAASSRWIQSNRDRSSIAMMPPFRLSHGSADSSALAGLAFSLEGFSPTLAQGDFGDGDRDGDVGRAPLPSSTAAAFLGSLSSDEDETDDTDEDDDEASRAPTPTPQGGPSAYSPGTTPVSPSRDTFGVKGRDSRMPEPSYFP